MRISDWSSDVCSSDLTMGEFALNGPTCDSLDVLPGTFTLPVDVREGDWIEIDQVGAYSNALATRFNGFHPDTFVQVFDAPPALAAALAAMQSFRSNSLPCPSTTGFHRSPHRHSGPLPPLPVPSS